MCQTCVLALKSNRAEGVVGGDNGGIMRKVIDSFRAGLVVSFLWY